MSSTGLHGLWPIWPDERVIFCDRDLVAIDKPEGVATHAPDAGRIDDAVSRLSAWLRARGEADYLGIHQRLDRDTSGVLVFTRRREVNAAIAAQFEGRRVEKTYVGVAAPFRERGATGTLRHRLLPERGGTMRALPPGARGGQEAVTRWRVVRRAGDRALLELSPETGRTHQIRVQLAAIGAPLAGDPMYDGAPARRLMLHARALYLVHPDGRRLALEAPAPRELEAWLDDPARAAALPGDVAAIEARLRAAAERRWALAHAGDTDAFRLANGAGDALPGVDVDRYGEHLVVALSGDEATRAREAVLDATARLGAKGVYLKVRPKHASVVADTRRDELAPPRAVRGEDAPESFVVKESGLPYEVRLGDGLSTGIFLDQRDNRRRVRELAAGARVLNLFSYTAPFTVAAVAGGARASTSVDVSRVATAWARRNLERVAASHDHVLVHADALGWLAVAARGAERFDLVVCDPPSFATTKTRRFSAETDYAGLAELAIRMLAPGGRLLACTNHRGISRARFRKVLHDAARTGGREVAQMKDLPPPLDFPPPPGEEPHTKSVLVLFDGRGR